MSELREKIKERIYGTTPDNEGKKALQASKKALEVPLLGENHMPLLQAKYPHRGFDLRLCRLLSKWWP